MAILQLIILGTNFLGNGAAIRSDNGNTVARISLAYYNGLPSATSTFGTFIIDILDYANTNKYKTTRALAGYDGNGSGGPSLDSGNWRNTNAITSIKLFNDGAYTFNNTLNLPYTELKDNNA